MQMLSNPIYARESPKFMRLKGNRVDEHDGDVRCKNDSENMATSCKRNASDHNFCISFFDATISGE